MMQQCSAFPACPAVAEQRGAAAATATARMEMVVGRGTHAKGYLRFFLLFYLMTTLAIFHESLAESHFPLVDDLANLKYEGVEIIYLNVKQFRLSS